jgi:hypothetical protein
MARGFESKSVADQQEQAESRSTGIREDVDPVVLTKRRKLELARVDVLRQIDAAHAQPHREMLKRALSALDKDLASLHRGAALAPAPPRA